MPCAALAAAAAAAAAAGSPGKPVAEWWERVRGNASSWHACAGACAAVPPGYPGGFGTLSACRAARDAGGCALPPAASDCYACVLPSTGCEAVDCATPGSYPSKAACAGACPVPTPPGPPSPPAPAPPSPPSGAKPTADDFWDAMLGMVNGGPRLTGSPGHKAFLDNVESTLTGLGFTVKRDVMKFDRWNADEYSLTVGGKDIPVAYPHVRSGLTPDAGLTLKMGASGGIGVTSGTMTVLGTTGCGVTAENAKKYKALVCCINQDQVQLKGDYQPFTNPSPKFNLPTLMVGQDHCAAVKAATGEEATLLLRGTKDPDTTAHVWGLLPGQTDDVVLVGVHSDGQNAVEENGIPSLLTMVKYLATLPLAQRKYTLGFAAVTGHMDYDVPHPETQGFATMHKKDLMKKVKACVAPEHFGTMQYVEKNGAMVATGKSVEYTGYGSSLKLQSMLQKAFKANDVSNSVVLTGPAPEEAGSALGWRLHGCPTVGGISLPNYLVNLDHGGPDKLDKGRFFELASSYMSVIEQLLGGAAVE